MSRFLIIVATAICVALTALEGQSKYLAQLKSQIGTTQQQQAKQPNETSSIGSASSFSATNDGMKEATPVTEQQDSAQYAGWEDPTVDGEDRREMSTDPIVSSNSSNVKDLWQHGLYDGPICPSLLKIAGSTVSQSTPFPKTNVTMMQLEGAWRDNETAAIYHRIYQHNAKVSRRHGYHPVSITNTSRWSDHPAFAKILAIRDYCVEQHNTELVWFLDGDIVLMNPLIPVEMIWFYYKAQHEQMNMLFASDNNDLNSGLFIVNCSSPTTIQMLEYWELYTRRVNSWKNIQSSMYEQNAIHWLIQTPFWQSFHPRYKRTDKLVRKMSTEEKRLYSVDELRKRVRVIDNICELTVFPIEFICDATFNEKYFTKGPRWWEPGHFAAHTAGTRNPALRIPYLVNLLEVAAKEPLPPPVATLQDAARQYLAEYQSKKSIDPPKTKFDRQTCLREERTAKRTAQEAYRKQQEAMREANTTV
jgi:hypothetical protein